MISSYGTGASPFEHAIRISSSDIQVLLSMNGMLIFNIHHLLDSLKDTASGLHFKPSQYFGYHSYQDNQFDVDPEYY